MFRARILQTVLVVVGCLIALLPAAADFGGGTPPPARALHSTSTANDESAGPSGGSGPGGDIEPCNISLGGEEGTHGPDFVFGSASDFETGIFSVQLLPGAFNLTLDVDPFLPGDNFVSFTVSLTNPASFGLGIVGATDGAGNVCTVLVQLGEFDPFGGLVQTPSRDITLRVTRPSPSVTGARCVETFDPDNPDFGSLPFLLFGSEEEIQIDFLLSDGDGTKIICCQFIDDGGNISPAICDTIELIEIVDPVCGNGIAELGEACDDGNAIPGDGCEADCTLSPGTPVPTVSQWGLLLFSLLLLTTGTLLFTRRVVAAPGESGSVMIPGAGVTFVPGLFVRVLALSLALVFLGFAAAIRWDGGLTSVDAVGGLSCAVVAAYLVHLWLAARKE